MEQQLTANVKRDGPACRTASMNCVYPSQMFAKFVLWARLWKPPSWLHTRLSYRANVSG